MPLILQPDRGPVVDAMLHIDGLTLTIIERMVGQISLRLLEIAMWMDNAW
jgi:hypothetical protein